MVNIRFFVDGKKIIENEYSNTLISNLNDVIKGGHIQKDKIYKLSFCRVFDTRGYEKELDLYLVNQNKKWNLFKVSDFRKFSDEYFAPLVSLNLKWKIYFNKMDDIKFVEVKTELMTPIAVISNGTNTNTAFECPVNYTTFISKQQHDMTIFTTYTNYEVEIEKMILNDKEVDGFVFEDFQTTNVLIKKICILKKKPNQSSYCIVC